MNAPSMRTSRISAKLEYTKEPQYIKTVFAGYVENHDPLKIRQFISEVDAFTFYLSHGSIAIVAILSVVVFFADAADRLTNYLFRRMYGMTGLVDTLEEYYQSKGSWQGVGRSLMLPI